RLCVASPFFSYFFFFYFYDYHRDLLSFPTRRSSDLKLVAFVWSTSVWYHCRSRSPCSSVLRGISRGGASVPPGAVAFTRMPCSAYSKARFTVSPFTPALAAP